MRIVTLGGGTGQGQLLRGLAGRGADVTAIVGVTDNGGHSGELRRLLGIPAVGDLRSCLAAAAPEDDPLARAMRLRFQVPPLEGASAGNLLLAAMRLAGGSLTRSSLDLGARLGLKARVLPVSEGSSQICAALADGSVIRGEWQIIRRKSRAPIRRFFHDPPLRATAEAREALRRADLIVLGPGSLITALVSLLLVQGVREALRTRKWAFVLNILTQAGQTDGFTAPDHLDVIARHAGRPPRIVIANTARPPAWAMEGAEFVDPESIEALKADLLEPVRRRDAPARRRPGPFPAGPHLVRHDPAKLARMILKAART